MKDRDVAAFDRRAVGYDSGVIGQMHQRIGERVADIALGAAPAARRVLDVGCGTGTLLRVLAARLPEAEMLAGIDPAPSMIQTASTVAGADPRVVLAIGLAEQLPFATDAIDLVVSVTSFDHWADQTAGLSECARVLAPGCPLVLCDLFSSALVPTMWIGRRGKAGTPGRSLASLAVTRPAAVALLRQVLTLDPWVASSETSRKMAASNASCESCSRPGLAILARPHQRPTIETYIHRHLRRNSRVPRRSTALRSARIRTYVASERCGVTGV